LLRCSSTRRFDSSQLSSDFEMGIDALLVLKNIRVPCIARFKKMGSFPAYHCRVYFSQVTGCQVGENML
ncbi:MAG: hypothetical protein KGI80_06370, partial [Verrucomicrobiota bacterium]|nr:hypothetical protein [Verrucomicrobiota bacterium]